MKLTFRTKLMLAFLLFSLVPTVIMTFVTTEALNQVKVASARLIYRGSYFSSQVMIRSPLDKVRDSSDAILDRANLAPVKVDYKARLDYYVNTRSADDHPVEVTGASWGVYLDAEPYSLVRFTWNADWAPGEESMVTVRLSDAEDGGTVMEFMHDRFLTPQSAAGHNQGWNSAFNKLTKFVEG